MTTTDEWGDPVAPASTAHDFEQNPILIGEYHGAESRTWEQNGEPRRSTIHRFIGDDLKPVDAWGSADLDRKLANVDPGSRVRIQYLGREEIGDGREIKRFEVRVSTAAPATPPADDDDIPF